MSATPGAAPARPTVSEATASISSRQEKPIRNPWSPGQPERGHQSARIFDGVCDQLDWPMGSLSLEQHRRLFVAGLACGARQRIAEAERAGSTTRDVYREIWQKMAAYLARYRANDAFERKKTHVSGLFQRLTDQLDRLIAEQKIDSRTARVFLRALPSLKHIGDYDAIVRNHDGIPVEDPVAADEAYARVVEGMWNRQQHARKKFEGFYHFNVRPHGTVQFRIYISARLSAAPDRLIQAWQAALGETGGLGTVYFKLPVRLNRRFETIVVYQTREAAYGDLEALLAFVRLCPRHLLNERPMPTAVPVYRGIAIAPEPAFVNKVVRYMGGHARLSYNQFIASVSKLAFELAYQDAVAYLTVHPTLQSLKSSARRYFDQMMRLAEIDPVTMMTDVQGVNLPAWIEAVSASG